MPQPQDAKVSSTEAGGLLAVGASRNSIGWLAEMGDDNRFNWEQLLVGHYVVLAKGPGVLATLFGVAVLLALTFAPLSLAKAMSVREILYLNKYGEGVSNVSWCSDKAFTFVTHGQARNASSVFPPEYLRSTTVSMFSTDTQQIRPLIVSEYAAFGAECVRWGEYVFLSGRIYSARAEGATAPAQIPFSQFVDVRPRARSQSVTPVLQLRTESFSLDAPLRTAPDGSVFARASSQALDLDSILPSKRPALIAGGLDYSVIREGLQITFANANSRKLPPGPFPLYGFSAPEIWSMGSYLCSAGRPECKSSELGATVAYYLYTKVNTDRARIDVVYTVTPLRGPIVRRWLVIGEDAATSKLRVSALALNASHCYVLLEPNPLLSENWIDGRLKMDLYISRCNFVANRLALDQAEIIGKKQASFIVPSLSLHGDFAVVTETTDLASQQESQVEVEREALSHPNVCARFFHASSWPLEAANTICVRLGQDEADGLTISPDGNFVSIRSQKNPLIVGREYRNDGNGPIWLSHGE